MLPKLFLPGLTFLGLDLELVKVVKLGWLGRLDGLGWPGGCGSWADGQPSVNNGFLFLLDWSKVVKLLSSDLGQMYSGIIVSVIQSFKDS